MKSDRKSAHSPGAQGHDEELRKQLTKLREQNNSMLGNQHLPKFEETIQQEPLTERLYDEQAPRDYGRRKVTGYKQGNNRGKDKQAKRGDVGGKGGY